MEHPGNATQISVQAERWIERVEYRAFGLICWAVATLALRLVKLDLVAIGVIAIAGASALYALTIGLTVRLTESAIGSALRSRRARATLMVLALTVSAGYLAGSTYEADHSWLHASAVVGVFSLGVAIYYRRRHLAHLVRVQAGAAVRAERARVAAVLQLCRKRNKRGNDVR